MQLYNIEAVPVRAHIICLNQMDLCQPIESEMDAACSSHVRQGTSAMKLKTTAVAVSCGDHTLDLFAQTRMAHQQAPTTCGSVKK